MSWFDDQGFGGFNPNNAYSAVVGGDWGAAAKAAGWVPGPDGQLVPPSGGSTAPPAPPGSAVVPWSGAGGPISIPAGSPTTTGLGLGGSPFPPATTTGGYPSLPGTSPTGSGGTPVFPGVGGSGSATPFPGAPGGTPAAPATPPAVGATTGGAPPSLGASPADDATLTAWLKSQGIADADIPYWMSSVKSKPDGLQSGNAQYWMDKIKGGQAAGGGTGGSGAGGAGGFGSFLAPFTGTFTAPTGTDDPGFQFALKQGTDAIQRSAAAKGNLLTGGTQKDLASYTTGAALQDYAGAYNRAANTFGLNRDVFYHNQDAPFSKLFDVTQLGYNAANSSNGALNGYMNNLTSLTNSYGPQQSAITTSTGNANANATATNANNTGSAINSGLNWFQQYANPYLGY